MKKLRFICFDEWGRAVYVDDKKTIWKTSEPMNKQPDSVRDTGEIKHKGLFTSSSNAIEGEPCWPMKPEIEICIE